MNRRSFLQGLLASPLGKYVPAPVARRLIRGSAAYLTSNTAWFLKVPSDSLPKFFRRKPRYLVKPSEWKGFYGSSGK